MQWLLIFENNETKTCSQIVFELVIIQVDYCFSKPVPSDFHLASYKKCCQNARQTILSIIFSVCRPFFSFSLTAFY